MLLLHTLALVAPSNTLACHAVPSCCTVASSKALSETSSMPFHGARLCLEMHIEKKDTCSVCVCVFCKYKHLEPKLNLRTNKQVPLHTKKQQVHVALNMFES